LVYFRKVERCVELWTVVLVYFGVVVHSCVELYAVGLVYCGELQRCVELWSVVLDFLGSYKVLWGCEL
jgi:hypothetical protein